MGKNMLQQIAFASLAFGLLSTPAAFAECATIQWEMPDPKDRAYFPQAKYIDCNTEHVKNSDSVYNGEVTDALVGSEINLGPGGSWGNYTKGAIVKSGINKFQCGGAAGSNGWCSRIK